MNLYEYQRSRSFTDLGPRSLRFDILNFFPLKPTEAQFHVKPPWYVGMKIYSNGPGHMTYIAAMPYMVKNRLIRNLKSDVLECWYAASGTQVLPSLFK